MLQPDPNTDPLGTTDNPPLVTKTNNNAALHIGATCIGTISPEQLSVVMRESNTKA